MPVYLLGLAPNMDQHVIVAAIVLCVGALVLCRLQSTDASDASRQWVPLTILFGTPTFGIGITICSALIDSGNSRSLEDCLNMLPAVVILSLVVGTIAALVLTLTQRRSSTSHKPELAGSAERADGENEFQGSSPEL